MLINRMHLAFEDGKGEGQCVGIALCLSRGSETWLETVYEVPDESMNLIFSKLDPSELDRCINALEC